MHPVITQKLDLPEPFDKIYLVYDCCLVTYNVLEKCQEIIQEMQSEVNHEIYKNWLEERRSELLPLITRYKGLSAEFSDIYSSLEILYPTLDLQRKDESHEISIEHRKYLIFIKVMIRKLKLLSRVIHSEADKCLDRLKSFRTAVRNQVPVHVWLESSSSDSE